MKENNNKGFTLIEILVAIIALGLVVVPLLQGFVTTANVNKKSREKMMATNVAQTYMEQYSGMTVKEIDEALNPDFATTGFVESTEHKYAYGIEGYSHNGSTYDIRLSVDASEYYNSRTNAEGDTVEGINDTGFAQVTSIDINQDAIYSESANVLTGALNEFVRRNTECIGAAPANADMFKSKLHRNITIIVEDKSDATGDYTEVNVQYQYVYVGDEGWVDSGNEEYTKSVNIFSNQSTPAADRKQLRNVYLLYRPFYDGHSENIKIQNYDNKEFNAYVIKMKTVDDTVTLKNLELNYVTALEVHEATMGTAAVSCAKVFTNLGYNIAVDDVNSIERVVAGQVSYKYWPNGPTGSTIENDKVRYDYFVPEYKGERMYRMKVEVYAAGAADAGFPEDDKLAEFSN